jgi:histidine triad (HIT) family protein
MNCIFCNIIERKASAEIVFENEKVIAFLDIKPIHLGHILVVPKIHCTDFINIPDDDLEELVKGTKIVAKALVESLNPDGYNIFSNNGKAAGQSVFHFHMHITPRYIKDEIHFKINLKDYKGSEMKNFAEIIRGKIKI